MMNSGVLNLWELNFLKILKIYPKKSSFHYLESQDNSLMNNDIYCIECILFLNLFKNISRQLNSIENNENSRTSNQTIEKHKKNYLRIFFFY